MEPVKFRILPPPPILENDVEAFRISEHSGVEALTVNVAPNALPGIVFQMDATGRPAIESIAVRSGAETAATALFIHGAGIEPSVMRFARGSYITIQAILKPHALQSLFGLNAAALSNNLVELGEFSGRDLADRLLDAAGNTQHLALIVDFLSARLRDSHPRDTLIAESLRLIEQDVACVSVRYLLDHLNISERHFERRFAQAVGVSPQAYIRVRRFNEAVRLIKTGQYRRLTDIAYALNYYDQSHLIRDVSAFSGLTPKALSQRGGDSYHAEAGYSYL
jgi:AraC-like DNA-binding protein